MGAGTVRLGGWITTVTVKLPVVTRPSGSRVVQVTVVVVFSPSVVPDSGEHVATNAPYTGLDAEATYVSVAPADEVAFTVNDMGSVSVGGGIVTVSVNEPLAV